MANTIPYIGSKISLISNSEIRYEGILYTINTQESTIALQSVKTFGTEGRKIPEIPPSSEIYDFIIFRGQDIKDLTVLEGAQGSSSPMLSDPAIMSMNQRPATGGKGGKDSGKGGGKADSGYGKGAGKQDKGSSSGGGGGGGSAWGGWGAPAKGAGKESRDYSSGWGGGKGDGWGKGGGSAWDTGKGKGDGWGKGGGKGKDYYASDKGGGGYGKGGGKGSFKGGKDDRKGEKGKGKGSKDGGYGKGKSDGYGKGKGDRGNRSKGSGATSATGAPVGELLPEVNSTVKAECAEDFDVDAANTKFEKVTDEGDKPKPLSGYSKTSSFFDNISCEATDRAADTERPKVDREKARQYDRDTFGDTRRPPRPVGARRAKGKGFGK